MPKREPEITVVESDIIDGAYVETWWDRDSQNWVTYLKTPTGYQVGDAVFDYRKSSAMRSHGLMIERADDMLNDYLRDRSDTGGGLEIRI